MLVKGDLAAAEPLLREALEGQRETLGSRDPCTLRTFDHLGLLLQVKGDLAAAELLHRESLEARIDFTMSRHHRVRVSRLHCESPPGRVE